MLNPHFKKLQSAYIFPIIEKKLLELQQKKPDQKIYNLGVGDVCLPLAPAIANAICDALQEMTKYPHGYGPSEGYSFLKQAICTHEYSSFGIVPQEIFISDGANTDAVSIQELFDENSSVLVTDPTYPAYRNANLLAGKTLYTLPLLEEEGFLPIPPKEGTTLAYLCTPCNPTGIAMESSLLEKWIAWAKKHKSILIIDNVYNAFISSQEIPSSIYAIAGAKEVAIELRSFSKTAGFTGLRCGYMVIPKQLHIPEIHSLWKRRIEIKTNGVAYPIQKGAEACYSLEGKQQIAKQIDTYKTSSTILRETLSLHGQRFYGGIHSPYIWWKSPKGQTSLEFFEELLEMCNIVTVPGNGFGSSGEGFVRLSCFLSPSLAKEATHALHHYFAAV